MLRYMSITYCKPEGISVNNKISYECAWVITWKSAKDLCQSLQFFYNMKAINSIYILIWMSIKAIFVHKQLVSFSSLLFKAQFVWVIIYHAWMAQFSQCMGPDHELKDLATIQLYPRLHDQLSLFKTVPPT